MPCKESMGLRGLCRFNQSYLRATHSIDLNGLSQRTMQWQNHFLLSFNPSEGMARLSGGLSTEIPNPVPSIVYDLANNLPFLNIWASRQEVFVIVRSHLGEAVGRMMQENFPCKCTFIHLSDLPSNFTLVQEILVEKYQEQMKTSRAVVLFPFDNYSESRDLQEGTLVDHPHWEAFALMVAYFIAKNSLEDMVLNFMLSVKYMASYSDLVLLQCPGYLLDTSNHSDSGCSKLLVHAIQYLSGSSFVEAGIASRIYFGFFWAPEAMYQVWPVEDFGTTKNFWGYFNFTPVDLEVEPMMAVLHVNPQVATDPSNFWSYLWKEKQPPSPTGQNLLVSMPGSGQSYVRILLEMLSQRPTRAVGY